MRNLKKIISLCLALCLVLSLVGAVSAAQVADATIDYARTGSIDIYKYDFTNAQKDGVWSTSYVSTGVYDQSVNDALGSATRHGDNDAASDLGNGQTSNGYAIKGVEFTYLKVANFYQFSESQQDGRTDAHVEIIYEINKDKGAELLAAIGLAGGKDSYANANALNPDNWYYQSDVLIAALRQSLAANATTVKNALEAYVKVNGGTAMALTDEKGHTAAKDLSLGLYLLVETKVPEMVTSTTDPFFVSLPMTSVNGDNAANGGQEWLYHVTLYPKNETGIPTLEKTVREAQTDTGKNNATSVIDDGFRHTATGSSGDVMEYQIRSTLPSITSDASQLSAYTFFDVLSAGLTYTKGDVVLEWFTDAACTDPIATWREEDGKFTVEYDPSITAPAHDTAMTIAMTETGLAEINTAGTVYTDSVRRGFSDCTLRITYTASIDSDNTVVFGDSGNPNDVVLTWKRTSSSYYDTLVEDAHVYTYGIDLTKLLSGEDGDFSQVSFVLYNATDGYWVQAVRNDLEGVYYVVDHLAGGADAEAQGATRFVPVKSGGADGKIIVKGLEDDTYLLTETTTSNGYVLLEKPITVVISANETDGLCHVYDSDVLGVVQNDPRYAEVVGNVTTVLGLGNVPQAHLEHRLLTASAEVDGCPVAMLEDNGSVNALAPLTVVNDHGFDLPNTGEWGAILLPLAGALLIGAALLLFLPKKRKEAN